MPCLALVIFDRILQDIPSEGSSKILLLLVEAYSNTCDRVSFLYKIADLIFFDKY